MEAIEQLLLVKTIDKITVNDITEYCGISRSTFYYHFEDLYKAVKALLEMRTQEVVRKIETSSRQYTIEEFFLECFNHLNENRETIGQIYKSAEQKEMQEQLFESTITIYRCLISVMSRGIPAGEEDKEIISKFYCYAMSGFLTEWLNSGMKTPFRDILHRIQMLVGDNIIQSLQRSAELQGRDHRK